MTQTEYRERITAAKIAYDEECRQIRTQYAKENNPVKIGDVITTRRNHWIIIKVERIEYYFSSYGGPMCHYFGTRLRQDGTPSKSQARNDILQSSLETINNKPYSFKNAN